jgi:hypothetical protein
MPRIPVLTCKRESQDDVARRMAAVTSGGVSVRARALRHPSSSGERDNRATPVADDFTGKAVVLVALGVGWRGHVWLPMQGLHRSRRGHHRGEYGMGVGRRVNNLTKPKKMQITAEELIRLKELQEKALASIDVVGELHPMGLMSGY